MSKLVFLATPLAIALAAPGPLAASSANSAARLEVAFTGIEHPTGQIMLSVFDSEAAHDGGGKPVRVAAVPVEGGRAIVTFDGLAPGSYAIKAFHDVDGDGQMAANPFGMPLEPFAFSNNAKAEGGPARWEKAQFAVASGDNTHSIAIK